MRIDLPTCGFKPCRYCFDGNCTKKVEYDRCEYREYKNSLRVHGRWDGDTCTACKLPWKYNMVQDADDWGYFDPMPDYCPNCGAKMDGGADNAPD